MPLEFPSEWRFDDDLGRMPVAAVYALSALIERVATQVDSPKWVYETVKARFGVRIPSSNTGFAQSDMDSALRNSMNIPEFLDAFWSAMEDLRGQLKTPSAEKINSILRQHDVGFAIRPPRLVREGKKNIIEAITRRHSPTPSKAIPALSDEAYEHIVDVIRITGHGMERAPGTYAEMDEESRRHVLLTALNTHYQGAAMAEAFNASGKTDILVRSEDCNVFIAECKFWSGPARFAEAIDQLFSYTAWRDTKLAIVVFVKEKGLTAVVEKGRQALVKHRQFASGATFESETELRATMRWPGDNEHLVMLHVFFFHAVK